MERKRVSTRESETLQPHNLWPFMKALALTNYSKSTRIESVKRDTVSNSSKAHYLCVATLHYRASHRSPILLKAKELQVRKTDKMIKA